MEKKAKSKAPVEMFNINAEANKYYPVGSNKLSGGIPVYRRPKSTGGSQRFSSFKTA